MPPNWERRAPVCAGTRRSPIAIATGSPPTSSTTKCPASFSAACSARVLKYSCCYWPWANSTLAEAEDAMLELFCQRAGIEEGMDILELGCGWGSLCLWIAQKYAQSRSCAVSNSRPKASSSRRCEELGLGNVEALTANIADFTPRQRFDRVLSVEMFEHLRNYEELLHRIAARLEPGGKLMVHIFCHARFAYPFETEARRTGWEGIFSPAASCHSTTCCCTSKRDLVLEDHRRFTCVELATGKQKWTTEPYGQYWSLVAQRDRILALDQRGELLLIHATPDEFDLLDLRKISEQETWGHLAVSGNQVFVRELNGVSAYLWK